MARTQVQSELLATNSISGTIIADNAITATHIATNAISGTLIQDSGIVTTMIAANNITATKVVTNAIQTRHIADDQVTEDKLANAINTSIAAKLPLAGGTMTGTIAGFTSTGIDDNADATAITIDSSERVLIGADSGDAFNSDSMLRLQRAGDRVFMQFKTDADQNSGILFGDVDDDVECAIEYEPANKALTFSTGNNAEAIRIDESGNVLVGHTDVRTAPTFTNVLQVEGTGAASASMGIIRNSDSINPPYFIFGKSRGASTGSNTIVQSGNSLGAIRWTAADGVDMNGIAAEINVYSGATPASNDTPGILAFSTTAEGSATSTERMRIDSSGNVGIGTDSAGQKLQVENGNIYIRGDTAGEGLLIQDSTASSGTYAITREGSGSTGYLKFGTPTNETHSFVFDGGSVGIGETTPLAKLHIKRGDSGLSSLNAAGDHIFLENTGSNGTGITLASGNTSNGSIIFGDQDSNYRGVLIYDHSADAMKFVTAAAERMRIGVTGKTSWSANGVGNVATQDRDFTFYTEGSTNGVAINSAANRIIFMGAAGSSGTGSDKGYLQLEAEGTATILFNAGGESAIAAGTFYVSGEGTAFAAGSHNGTQFATNGQSVSSRAATNLQTHKSFYNPNGSVGTIKTTGSATQFNTSSDYRLKENVVTDWDATSLLKQLKPSKFNFKADTDTTVQGFLAHEVSSIVPQAVSGEKDAVYTAEEAADGEGVEGQPNYQGIDQSKLVPLLVKTIQELEARIATLEG